ncbi:hypothetical protein JQC67_17495 [Aurantibacter crassamenti]|uniref:hypothetical protein n=1 Tax=Aurantibacter crassamenti TaxID=1837375 RepID=UPI0019396299|nr:hypothetical protein [Aurantibacter crassamenti]MBM1107954.1 hypothetical protein [Aurantibacter crassamenti]
MASVKGLKKDINNVLGDIIEAVYIVEASNSNNVSKEGEEVIESVISTFEELIAKVNQRKVENRKKHLNSVKDELETKARALVEQVNKLA